MRESKPMRVQGQARKQLLRTVLIVPENRVSEMFHMQTQLMRPAGLGIERD
jgi:hypothetical protein